MTEKNQVNGGNDQVAAPLVMGRQLPGSIPSKVLVPIPPELSPRQRADIYRALQRIVRWRDRAWVVHRQNTETEVASQIIAQMDYLTSGLKNYIGLQPEVGALISEWWDLLKKLNGVAKQLWEKAKEVGVVRKDAEYRDPLERLNMLIERRKGIEISSETDPEKRASDMEEIATRAMDLNNEV